jgi:hypothetical protein
MRDDWENPDVTDPYSRVIGDKKTPLGDDWRYWLANPVIWAVARHLLTRHHNGNGHRKRAKELNVVKVHEALAAPRTHDADRCEAWYETTRTANASAGGRG